MKVFHHLLLLMTAVISMMPLAGCVYDYYDDDDSRDGVFLSLRIRYSDSSRSNPTGGEDGDGREYGQPNEDKIESISLFFYKSSVGINDDADTPIYYYTRVADLVSQDIYRIHLQNFTPKSELAGSRVLVAVNLPDIEESKRSTLGLIRESLVENAWTPGADRFDIPGCKTFVMATADEKDPYDGRLNFNHEGTSRDPYLASVDVERVAARVDLMFDNINIGENGLVYDVAEPIAYGDAGKIHITHAVPVNLMQKPSWLVKQVSADFSSVTYCGEETKDSKDRNTNYVVEPLSLTKNRDGDDTDTDGWYFNPAASVEVGIGNLSSISTWELSKWLARKEMLLKCVDNHDRQMTIAYTNENTQGCSLNSPKFLTGLMLRTVFVPEKIYSDAELKSQHPDTYGETFWRYSFTKKNMASMSEKALYFDNEEALKRYVALHPQDPATVSTRRYDGGVCYYNVWIRHSNAELGINDNYEGSWPMEYGIVRNNIYRVGFRFSGPGSPEPDLRQPETVSPRIFVRKWNLRRMKEIIA